MSLLLSLSRGTVLLPCQADPHTGASWAEQLDQQVDSGLANKQTCEEQTILSTDYERSRRQLLYTCDGSTNYNSNCIIALTFIVIGLKIIKLHTESLWRIWLNMDSATTYSWMLKTRETGEIEHASVSKAPININELFHSPALTWILRSSCAQLPTYPCQVIDIPVKIKW